LEGDGQEEANFGTKISFKWEIRKATVHETFI
jgi:hypothetical protein